MRPATESEEEYLDALDEEERLQLEHLYVDASPCIEHEVNPTKRSEDCGAQWSDDLLAEMLHKGAEFLRRGPHPADQRAWDLQTLACIRAAAGRLQGRLEGAISRAVDRERQAALEARMRAEARLRRAEQRLEEAEVERVQLHHQMEDLRERTLCIICCEKEREAVVLPCMHFNYCAECLARVQESSSMCPTCRTPISGILKCCLSSR